VSASHVANILNLPGFDTPEITAILHTKDKFRRFCVDAGIPVPRVLGEFNSANNLNVPASGSVIVKPADSFSGRGVEVIANPADVEAAVGRALLHSRTGSAVVEEFVSGSLHSHTAFISSKKIIWHDYVDEHCEVYPYQVDRSTYPSQLPTIVRQEVNECMQKIVELLDLTDGLLHTQFIASKNAFWIIECMRRCPGDLYGHHFQYALDFDYEAQYVAGFLGSTPTTPQSGHANYSVERQVLSTARDEAFFGFELTGTRHRTIYVPLKDSGGLLRAAPFDKAGILFHLTPLGLTHGAGTTHHTQHGAVSTVISYPFVSS
jgi:biotin carboxylase